MLNDEKLGFPLISAAAKKYMIEAIAYAGAGVATKGVGSMFRIRDDLTAPDSIKFNTIKREATMLSIAGASMMAIQVLFSFISRRPAALPTMQKIFKSKNNFRKAEPLLRLFLAIPAFMLAESVSRFVGPRGLWGEEGLFGQTQQQQHVKDDDDREDESHLNRITPSQPTYKTTSDDDDDDRPVHSPPAYQMHPPVIYNTSLPFSRTPVSNSRFSSYYSRSNQPPQIYFHA